MPDTPVPAARVPFADLAKSNITDMFLYHVYTQPNKPHRTREFTADTLEPIKGQETIDAFLDEYCRREVLQLPALKGKGIEFGDRDNDETTMDGLGYTYLNYPQLYQGVPYQGMSIHGADISFIFPKGFKAL